jgi:glycosyltransferase involved in cell wall biosynthesis
MGMVSIFIPTYNMANYLPVALDSALAQDRANIEIVVVDDGSTDDTYKVIRPYLPHIRYFRQEQQGVVHTLNRAVELARGEYVRLLAADDALCPDALSAQAALLDGNPQVALVHSQAYIMDEAGNVRGRKRLLTNGSVMIIPSPQAFRRLLRGNDVCASTVMLRKAALQRVGPFQRESFPGEDWDMWLRITAHYDEAYIPKPLAYYRVHRNSITAGYTLSGFTDSHRRTLQALFARPDLPYPQLENLAYACLDRNTAQVAARLRHRGPFARHLTRALRSQPRLLLERETWNTLFEGAKAFLPLAPLRAVRGAKRTIVARRRAFAEVVTSAPRLGGDAEKRPLAEVEAARRMEGESNG